MGMPEGCPADALSKEDQGGEPIGMELSCRVYLKGYS